jgi:hypothetical protein
MLVTRSRFKSRSTSSAESQTIVGLRHIVVRDSRHFHTTIKIPNLYPTGANS